MRRWTTLAGCALAIGVMRAGSCAEFELHSELQVVPAAERANSRGVPNYATAVATTPLPARVLRGDFEPPETLVIAFDRDWEATVLSLTAAARGRVDVELLVQQEDLTRVQELGIGSLERVKVLQAKLDSPWVRDYGPLQVHERGDDLVWLDFDYTWSRPADDRMPRWLSHVMGARREASTRPFDGGAVISNGKGLCAITTTSLREAGVGAEEERALGQFLSELGCAFTAILPSVPGERTGHADMIGQFVSEEHVLVAEISAELDPAASASLDQAVRHLELAASLVEQPLEVTRVPVAFADTRFYSYVNMTSLGSRLLVPHFSAVDPAEEQRAHAVIKRAVPGVELVAIGADSLISHGGALHCATLGLGPTALDLSLPTRSPVKRGRDKLLASSRAASPGSPGLAAQRP